MLGRGGQGRKASGRKKGLGLNLRIFPEVAQLYPLRPGLFPSVILFCLIKFLRKYSCSISKSIFLYFCLHWTMASREWVCFFKVFFKNSLLRICSCLCDFTSLSTIISITTKLHPESDKGHQVCIKDLFARWLTLLLLIKFLLINILLL